MRRDDPRRVSKFSLSTLQAFGRLLNVSITNWRSVLERAPFDLFDDLVLELINALEVPVRRKASRSQPFRICRLTATQRSMDNIYCNGTMIWMLSVRSYVDGREGEE